MENNEIIGRANNNLRLNNIGPSFRKFIEGVCNNLMEKLSSPHKLGGRNKDI